MEHRHWRYGKIGLFSKHGVFCSVNWRTI